MIPYGKQDVTEEDIDAVSEVLRSDFLTQGSVVPAFERKLCDYTGAKYSVVVNSCTSALHIACLALDLSHGDIVWTSPITFVASANCALYCGATIDFVDIESDTALMSVEKLAEKLEQAEKKGKLPKIVIPVHFAGQPCDMEEIHTLGKQYGFRIIEDAAHAIGSKYKNKTVGSCQYSDITVFSFHPVKIITTGEGGAAMTNSLQLAEKMELLRSHGVTRNTNKMHNKPDGSWYYEQIDIGFNYRMTDIQAALGNSQLTRLDKYISRRNEISKWYDEKFKETDFTPLLQKPDRVSACHLYVILVRGGWQDRGDLYNNLQENCIGVNLHYMPIYKHKFFYSEKKFENSENYYKKAISLPIYPTIDNESLDKVVNGILHFKI
jgi:UDP-4-amino-4,6-dideoxy-N-acetyl-beta-L-altrosamine transaminase